MVAHAELRVVVNQSSDDDGLVSKRRDDCVRVVYQSGDCHHPIGVGIHGATEYETILSHLSLCVIKSLEAKNGGFHVLLPYVGKLKNYVYNKSLMDVI